MIRKIFGTDGVRGKANNFPVTAEVSLRLGSSAGHYFRSRNGAKRVILGKDTRRSCYMLENALTAGFTSVGMDVFLLGPVPTPAVGFLTKSMRADLGVMISASHNSFEDNGIKFFGPDGFKLSDSVEAEIEDLFNSEPLLVEPQVIGKASRIDDGLGRYIEFVKTTLPQNMRLNGLKIVIDCANGASYKAAPEVLWELGAEVIAVGNKPDGSNINFECGSMHPSFAAKRVVDEKADLGICLDGDSDRVTLIDEKGSVVDGDQLLAFIATMWSSKNRLRGNGVVATVMSNMGLADYLSSINLSLHRTSVGDRYVVEKMREGGFNLGGEQSGHIILSDYVTTGDGLLAGLQFLVGLVKTGESASQLLTVFDAYPQLVTNIDLNDNFNRLNNSSLRRVIEEAESEVQGKGRIIVRKSGTEPIIRIMVEHQNKSQLTEISRYLADHVRNSKN